MRKLILTLMAIGAVAALLAAVPAQDDPLASPTLRIEWRDFKTLYDAKHMVVIDVRDAGSYGAGHVPGALTVPLDQIDTRVGELKKLKKPIVLYCA
jgi:predicted sulfurtransferase